MKTSHFSIVLTFFSKFAVSQKSVSECWAEQKCGPNKAWPYREVCKPVYNCACDRNEYKAISRDEHGETCDVRTFLNIGYPRTRCVCRPGYVRKAFGEICIPKNQCRNKNSIQACGANEEFARKYGPQQTCETLPQMLSLLQIKRGQKPAFMNGHLSKIEAGCFCSNGFIRRFDQGPCVPKNACTDNPLQLEMNSAGYQCGNNEFFGTFYGPESFCGDDVVLKRSKRTQCWCDSGFVRDKRGFGGKCVRLEECEKKSVVKKIDVPRLDVNRYRNW